MGDENVPPHLEKGVKGVTFMFLKATTILWHIIDKVVLSEK